MAVYFALLFVALVLSLVLKLWLDKRLIILKANHELTKANHVSLLKDYQKLHNLNQGLSGKVQDLVELYEITKELTKHLSFSEVFAVFQERLNRNIIFQDCKFIEPQGDSSGFSGYELFPLNVAKDWKAQLAIKGIKEEDKEKFYILLNQFLLVLKRVRLYAKIEELSITDSLTGLFLRRYLQERLEQEINRCDKFGLNFVFLMLDLDHFKSYNDRYGHLVGDVLLSAVAKIIKEHVRQIDTVARYGGEEFSVILPSTDREEARYVSLRLRQEIEKKHIRAYDEDLQITVSIGASLFPKDAKDTEDLINKADEALYHAKQTGRNRVCFWDEIKRSSH